MLATSEGSPDIRNAGRDFLPHRLATTVVREESRRLPYRWEVVYILGNGRVRVQYTVHSAFGPL
jgi:hypothetical protein